MKFFHIKGKHCNCFQFLVFFSFLQHSKKWILHNGTSRMTWINAKHQFSIQQVELHGLANRCKCGNHSFSTKIKLNSEKKELELWDWQNETMQYPSSTWGEVIELMWMEPIGIDDHWGPLLDSYRWTLNSRQCQCTLNIPPCGVLR